MVKIDGQFTDFGWRSVVIGINGSKPSNIRGDRVDLLIYDEAGSWPDFPACTDKEFWVRHIRCREIITHHLFVDVLRVKLTVLHFPGDFLHRLCQFPSAGIAEAEGKCHTRVIDCS